MHIFKHLHIKQMNDARQNVSLGQIKERVHHKNSVIIFPLDFVRIQRSQLLTSNFPK